jgi:hypothetical protein
MLWYTLGKYDYPHVEKTLFDARWVFLLLAVGIVFGMIVTMLDASIIKPPDLIVIIVLAFGFATFEEMFKFIVLNLKKFQIRFDTVFYGFSLGVGLSSTFVLSHVYATIGGASSVSIATWLTLIIYSIILCLLHGSTGSIIGLGAAKGRPWHYFVEAMVIRAFFIIVLIPVIANIGGEWASIISLIAAFLLAILIYRMVATDIIPSAIPKEIKRRRRIKSRRIIRRKA